MGHLDEHDLNALPRQFRVMPNQIIADKSFFYFYWVISREVSHHCCRTKDLPSELDLAHA